MRNVEDHPRLLVNHIRIETFRTQQGHAFFENLTLVAQFFEDRSQIFRTGLQSGLRDQAVFTMECVKSEIG